MPSIGAAAGTLQSDARRPDDLSVDLPRFRMTPRFARRVAVVALVAVALYIFGPATLAVLNSWPRVTELQWWWLAAMAITQSASVWCLWHLQAAAIGTEDLFAIGTSQLAGGALGKIIPGGAATATAAQYGMIAASTDDDVRRSHVATGLAVATVLQVAVLCALPLLAVPAVIFGLAVPRTFLETALLGLAIFTLLALITFVARRSEAALRAVGSALTRLSRRLAFLHVPPRLGDGLVAYRDEAVERLGERLPRAMVATIGRWLLDLMTLVAAVIAVGGHASLWLLLLAFFTTQLLGQVPITPGGIGLVEAGLTGALVLAGLSGSTSTIATLAYRLFNFGLMLPAGLIGWMAHRNRLRRLGRQEFDPDLLLDRPDHDLVVADTDPVGGDKPASTTFFHDAVDADRTGRK